MSEAKERNARISNAMIIKAFLTLRTQRDDDGHEDVCPTSSELTSFLNGHKIVQVGMKNGHPEYGFIEIPNGETRGTRKHESIQSRVSQLRTDISDDKNLSDEIKETLLNMLEFRGAPRKDSMSFNDIAINILGMTLVPANMVPGSGYVGTNGNAVSEYAEA